MQQSAAKLPAIIERARALSPIRVAVVNAAQRSVLETVREAQSLGLITARLVGEPAAIRACGEAIGWPIEPTAIVAADSEAAAASVGVDLVRRRDADVVMKGHLHTDTFMRALLDDKHGLRLPGRRVSHVFVTDVPSYPKLLSITDAAINIAPDLNGKAQIAQNAIELAHLLGVPMPKVAVLSAVETVNPAIASTLDAACLTLMGRRGQIRGALIDGPLAFDNAISALAAKEKGIESSVAGDADIVLVPDLVSGNILAKDLEYLAGATAAGIVLGLSAPVLLNSRADPPQSKLAAFALAVLLFHDAEKVNRSAPVGAADRAGHCAPQPECLCCPLPA